MAQPLFQFHSTDALFEFRASGVRDEILALAARLDAPVDSFVAGVADALAYAAAKLDRDEGRQNLADRLDAFCARVEETYAKDRNARG